jgi:hypothetical protein
VTDVTQHEQLEQAFSGAKDTIKDITDRLDQKSAEAQKLEELNHIMLGRELRMADLKKENADLHKMVAELEKRSQGSV